jgi:hypothetical protein
MLAQYFWTQAVEYPLSKPFFDNWPTRQLASIRRREVVLTRLNPQKKNRRLKKYFMKIRTQQKKEQKKELLGGVKRQESHQPSEHNTNTKHNTNRNRDAHYDHAVIRATESNNHLKSSAQLSTDFESKVSNKR